MIFKSDSISNIKNYFSLINLLYEMSHKVLSHHAFNSKKL